jgi:hypothetical protein
MKTLVFVVLALSVAAQQSSSGDAGDTLEQLGRQNKAAKNFGEARANKPWREWARRRRKGKEQEDPAHPPEDAEVEESIPVQSSEVVEDPPTVEQDVPVVNPQVPEKVQQTAPNIPASTASTIELPKKDVPNPKSTIDIPEAPSSNESNISEVSAQSYSGISAIAMAFGLFVVCAIATVGLVVKKRSGLVTPNLKRKPRQYSMEIFRDERLEPKPRSHVKRSYTEILGDRLSTIFEDEVDAPEAILITDATSVEQAPDLTEQVDRKDYSASLNSTLPFDYPKKAFGTAKTVFSISSVEYCLPLPEEIHELKTEELITPGAQRLLDLFPDQQVPLDYAIPNQETSPEIDPTVSFC